MKPGLLAALVTWTLALVRPPPPEAAYLEPVPAFWTREVAHSRWMACVEFVPQRHLCASVFETWDHGRTTFTWSESFSLVAQCDETPEVDACRIAELVFDYASRKWVREVGVLALGAGGWTSRGFE